MRRVIRPEERPRLRPAPASPGRVPRAPAPGAPPGRRRVLGGLALLAAPALAARAWAGAGAAAVGPVEATLEDPNPVVQDCTNVPFSATLTLTAADQPTAEAFKERVAIPKELKLEGTVRLRVYKDRTLSGTVVLADPRTLLGLPPEGAFFEGEAKDGRLTLRFGDLGLGPGRPSLQGLTCAGAWASAFLTSCATKLTGSAEATRTYTVPGTAQEVDPRALEAPPRVVPISATYKLRYTGTWALNP